VKCNLSKAFQTYVEWSTAGKLMKDREILSKISLEDNQENLDMYFFTKFPFPFAPRDFVVSFWTHFTPAYATILMGSVERMDKPLVRGKVRGKIISITILEADLDDPNWIKMLIFGQSDYRVKLPAWIASEVWRGYYYIIKEMRELMEK